MKIIDFRQIESLAVSPAECMEWVYDALLVKDKAYLPPKYSLKLDNDIFINTMPCSIPELGIFGVKIVSRYPLNIPSLDSTLLLYDLNTGELLALMDANWITAMRTGAVASLAVKTLERSEASIYSIMGLGNTARATLLCMLHSRPEKFFTVRLLMYKDQAERFAQRFSDYKNIRFEIVGDPEKLIRNADVIISCITSAKGVIAPDDSFREGVLVVPVHTRGFQNCDLFFDKVFADDTEHVRGFKYFDRFRRFAELGDVLKKKVAGRETQEERILSYNIGIALHDIYFAGKILKKGTFDREVSLNKSSEKFWL
ncbi:MAG: ornithine cyclodeaminase family protein [Bacteroidales bacterium]|nr:ornithine cyclodeaminase family protein [Bacteroidales bacterium]